MRSWTMAAVAGLAIPAVFASGVLGDAPHPSGANDGAVLSMGRAGLIAPAARGSFCAQPPSDGGGVTGGCGDAAYPLRTRGRLPVRPGARVIVRPSVEASDLEAHLVRVHGSRFTLIGGRLRVRPLAGGKWAVELPARLGTATVLDVFIRWDNAHDGQGDADFWGAIRTGCR